MEKLNKNNHMPLIPDSKRQENIANVNRCYRGGQKPQIGILYVGLNKYAALWKDFYNSAEKYFLPKLQKQYFVFTDEDEKIGNHHNVTVYHTVPFGSWSENTACRFQLFSDHFSDFDKCDYMYFFNADVLFRRTISPKEFIPTENDGYLLALSFTYYIDYPKKTYPYERRKESQAYIPYGAGSYYFQGGVFGGRLKEFTQLVTTCLEWTRIDAANNIVACGLDESHLNKYLLDKKVKVVGTKYGKGENMRFYWYCKIIFRDKYKALGEDFLQIKPWYNPENKSVKNYSVFRYLRKQIKRIIFYLNRG